MQLDIFLIAASTSLREALQRIENNHHGMIFITDADGSVCGVATDGDIRRRPVNRRDIGRRHREVLQS
jgi:CBS domain containing-hemolysin-like protein